MVIERTTTRLIKFGQRLNFSHILLLRSTASSMRNPSDCSKVPNSEIREEPMAFPSVPLKATRSSKPTVITKKKNKNHKK